MKIRDFLNKSILVTISNSEETREILIPWGNYIARSMEISEEHYMKLTIKDDDIWYIWLLNGEVETINECEDFDGMSPYTYQKDTVKATVELL